MVGVVAAAVSLGGVSLAPGATAASVPCGASKGQSSPSGVQTIRYYNCSSIAVKLRPQFKLFPDGACKVVSPYAVQEWDSSGLWTGKMVSC